MRILWLTWKDKTHPLAGGAEVVSSELGKRLVAAGHEVIFLTAGYDQAEPEANIDGYRVIRVGGRVSVYWQAYRYVRKHLSQWPDLVVEEINTMPFLSRLYLGHKPRLLFFHMLCREIWFYQLKLPASIIGYVLEPLYLRFLRRERTVAMSASTKSDLVQHGFEPTNISVISEGIQIDPVHQLNADLKHEKPTLVSLGSIRPMKRTLDQIKAFELAKASIPNLQLKVAGDSSGKYGQRVLEAINNSPYKSDIEYLGRVSATEKVDLLRRAHLITVTSIKEGWGLIVTEAASQGTPAAVYDVDGLRDSVRDGETGAICARNTPAHLAENIIRLLSNRQYYEMLQTNAWKWSKHINFETSYRQFIQEIS